MYFGMLTKNPVIDCALLAWFLAQLIKVILDVVLAGKLEWQRFFSSGGMPSSHSALVVSAATAVGRTDGFGGNLFALSHKNPLPSNPPTASLASRVSSATAAAQPSSPSISAKVCLPSLRSEPTGFPGTPCRRRPSA